MKKFALSLHKKNNTECFFCQATPAGHTIYVCYKCHKKFRKEYSKKIAKDINSFQIIEEKYDEELRERLIENRLSKIENILN